MNTPIETELPELNLDDEASVSEFLNTYGTDKGRRLANALGLSGKGSAKLATSLSNYAWNKSTAIKLRREGEIAAATRYEAICDRIYSQIPEDKRPW